MRLHIEKTRIDRAIESIAPGWAAKRYQKRYVMAMAESYAAGSRKRSSMAGWNPLGNDADTDILPDLPAMRNRSRDLNRNSPIARAITNTKVTNVVGYGLTLKSQLDRKILGLSQEEADEAESRIEAEWRLFSESKYCDITGTLNFRGLQGLTLRSVLENGDLFTLLIHQNSNRSPYSLRIQHIEADRVCNEKSAADSPKLAGGILTNEHGEVFEYQVLAGHPGNIFAKTNEWRKIKPYRENGLPNMLHHFNKLRVGQRRGVPDLAPVIEAIKQLTRYTEAELMAAVVQSFFTIFVKTADGEGLGFDTGAGGSSSDGDDYKMGYGNMIDLNPDEEVSFADPNRPNKQFDGFVNSLAGMIGAAVEIPREILLKHFTSSYSASRAALLEAWRFFINQRKWLIDSICLPVYEVFFYEAVSLGRIYAPGYLTGDPLIKRAWLGADWIGPSRGMIDELKEAEAAERRLELGLTTLAEETAALTGGDWEKKHPQRVKEVKKRLADGLELPLDQVQEFRR